MARHDRETGPCGFHPSIANDKENVFTPQTNVCLVCAGIAKHERIQSERDKKAVPDDAPPTMSRPADGRFTSMRLLSPEEAAQARQNGPRGAQQQSRTQNPTPAGPPRASG